jgi:hypothetical protein
MVNIKIEEMFENDMYKCKKRNIIELKILDG